MQISLTRCTVGAAVVLTSACVTSHPTASTESRASVAPTGDYQAAVARVLDRTRVMPVQPLTAIAEGNPRLEWRERDGVRLVLVSTWTDWDGFQRYQGTGEELTMGRDGWVAAPRDLKDRCNDIRDIKSGNALRLSQLLGLPGSTRHRWFVELWVDPAAIFRPCPDAEIGDTTCETDLPANASDKHRAWFANQKLSAYYEGQQKYPWTRRGYTYDWGSADGVGISEFVVPAGSKVLVHSITSTRNYCD